MLEVENIGVAVRVVYDRQWELSCYSVTCSFDSFLCVMNTNATVQFVGSCEVCSAMNMYVLVYTQAAAVALYKYFVAWQLRVCRVTDFRQVVRGPGSWLHEWQGVWRPSADLQCSCWHDDSSFQNWGWGADTRATRSAATGHWVSCIEDDWTYRNANIGSSFADWWMDEIHV